MNEAGQPEVTRSGRRERARHRARSVESAAVAGLVYAVLTALTLVRLSRYPSLDSSDEELSSWFDDSAHQAWLIGALTLASFGSIAFLWFVAVIRRRLGDLEDRFFATVFFGSAIAYTVVWLIGAAVLAAPAVAMTQLDAASVSPASASLAAGIGGALILVVAPRLQSVFIFTTSSVILRSRVLPNWLAILGYVIGLVLFVLPLITDPAGMLFPAWVFVVSLVMLLDRSSQRSDETPADEVDGLDETS